MFLLSALILFLQFPFAGERVVYADEVAAEEGAEADAENPEGIPEDAGEDGEASGGSGAVVPGPIQADNGKYIALSFPENIVPNGFTTTTVPYGGEQVMIAQMPTKSTTIGAEGMVVYLAYLTDEDGSNGDFYLCDVTEEAHMSDMILIHGVDNTYIIILDPGDNINGPDGFTKRKLKWGSKSAVAWSLPKSSSEDEDEEEEEEDDEEDEKKESRYLFTQQVYAGDLFGVGAGAGGDDEESDGGSDEIDEAAEKAMSDYIAESEIAHTNAAGLIQAQPEDFCLLYAVSESGDVGFYLYDIKYKTYQRYVDIPHGESDTLAKYKKQSRIRLFIIAGMLLVILVLVFIIINLALKKNQGSRNDVFPKESVRARPRRKARDEDYEEDDEDEEAERYEAALQAGRPQRNTPPARETMRGDRGPAYSDNGSDLVRPSRTPYGRNGGRVSDAEANPYRDTPRREAPARDPYADRPRRDMPARDPYRDQPRREAPGRDPYSDPAPRDMSRRPRRNSDDDDMISSGGGMRGGRQGDDLDDDFTFEFLNVDK